VVWSLEREFDGRLVYFEDMNDLLRRFFFSKRGESELKHRVE